MGSKAYLFNLDVKNNNSQSVNCSMVSSISNDHNELNISKLNECNNGNILAKMEISDDSELEDIGNWEPVMSHSNAVHNIGSNINKTVETNNDLEQNSNEDISESKPRKRKQVARSRKTSQVEETDEKLFIRLKKSKVSRKQLSNDSNFHETSHLVIKQEPTLNPQEKPTIKYSKTEISRQNLINVNKTESLKLEQMLLEKARKTKERQRTENTLVEESENSAGVIEIEPYIYEKTSKSVFETYERKEEENGQVILKCLLCPFHSEKFQQMSLHYKFKHKETPIEEMHFCDVKGCRFKTVHQGMLKWHMRRHMLAANKITTSLFPCSQCDKVFDHRKGYLIHLKHKHKDPSPSLEDKKTDYPCSTCNFRTSTKSNLQAHVYRCHIPDSIKPTLTCNICGYKTHYKDCFKKHLTRVHLKKGK